MTQSRGDAQADPRVLADLLVNFNSLPTAEARDLAETKPVLLSDDADRMSRAAIFALLREANDDAALRLERHRLLLLRCRRLGVRQAFDQLPEVAQLGSDELVQEMQRAYVAVERSPTAGNLDDYIAALLDLALLAPPGHPAQSAALHNLGGAFLQRHGLTGDLSDVLAAVVVRQGVVAMTPLADPLRPNRLSGLGKALIAWMNETGDRDAGVAAVAVYEEALEVTSPDDPTRSAALAALGGMLLDTHAPEGDIHTLTRAIGLFEEALGLPFVADDDRLLCVQQLARALLLRFAQGRDPADRDKAIEVFDPVFATLDANSAQRRFHSGYFGNELLAVYLSTAELLLLDRAIELLGIAVDQAGLGTGDVGRLHDLGIALLNRYDRRGAVSDLRRGLDTLRRVIRVLPAGAPRPSVSHFALAEALLRSYQANDDPDQLDEAVALLELPTPDVSPGLVDGPYRLAVLGRLLTARYLHRRAAADLDNAIGCLDEALANTPPDHFARLRRLQALGRALQLRFQRSGDESDIRRAVTVLEECVANGPSDPLILPSALSVLGVALWNLHAGSGDHAELARAVELTRQGAEQTPVGSPELAAHLWNYLLVSRGSTAADGGQPPPGAVHRDLLERCRELQDVRTAIAELDPDDFPGDRASPDPGPGIAATRIVLPPPLIGPAQRAIAAWVQFGETGADDSLSASVDAWRSVLSHGLLSEVPAQSRNAILTAAAQAFAARFERTGSLSDADAAIGAYDRVTADLADDGDQLRHALISMSVCLLRRHNSSRDTADVNRALDRLAAAARRPPHGDDVWTDAVHRFIGAMSVHVDELTRTMASERWLEVADELLALAPGELAGPAWYRYLLVLALFNAAAGQNRWAAAQRWADAASVSAAAAGDVAAVARAEEISRDMGRRLTGVAGTAKEVLVDVNDLINSIGDRSDPAAARERLATLRAAIGQISPADDIVLFGLLTAGLMQELVMGPTGDPAANMEEALDLGRDLLITLREGAAAPSLIATVCGDLANLYLRRAHGAHRGNVERAIELAIERTDLLEPGTAEWADAQAQLGFVLTERVGRERAAAAEQAVTCCKAALQVLDPGADTAGWAYARNALGCAYQATTSGLRAENLERARQLLEETLDVLGDTPPEETNARRTWANLHYNLGTIYQARLLGGNDDNMRRAIHHYGRELSVSSRDRDPISWATTQVSLASAYSRLGGDDPAETQRRAVAALESALSIFSRDRTPERWARAQDELGLVLCDADQVGRRPIDLEAAAECFTAALQVYGRESHPSEWAGVQMNRAMVDRMRAARATAGSQARQTHLAEAAAHYRQALEVYAPGTLPLHFADAQASLGDALVELAQEGDELQDAARALEAALEIYQANGMSRNIRMLAPVLAQTYGRLATHVPGGTQDQGLPWWRRAALVCDAGMAATNALYESSLLRGSKDAELRLARSLLSTGVAALVRLGRPEDALVLLERGRARWLSEALARDRADLHQLGSRHQDLIEDYRDAAQQIEAVERLERQSNRAARAALGDARPVDSGDELLQQAAHARERMRQAIEQIRLIPGYSQFLQLPDLDDIARVVTEQEALTVLVPSIDGCLILVAHRDQTGEIVVDVDRVPDLTERALDGLLLGTDASGPSYLQELYGGGEFIAALDTLLQHLGSVLVSRVARQLRDLGAASVMLVPAGRLSLTALHAAPYETDGQQRCLLDEFDVRYAPSAVAMAVPDAQDADCHAQPQTQSLVGIADPNGDLPYAEAELDEVAAMFAATDTHLRAGTAATKAGLLADLDADAHEPTSELYIHLACHGFTDPARPLDSYLQMAGPERLTLSELLDSRVFRHTRLVVASACQTAITDFANLPDEAIGLASGCLHAGAPAVIGTLWSVNDLSTALLMMRFYHYHRNGDPGDPLPLARALRLAQCWLRDVTAGQLEAFFDSHEILKQVDRWPVQVAAAGSVRFILEDADSRPFANPYYWAPFILAGA
jgi:CHAT domain-containing protein/tetratricopeptide (TPR) repeat protein